MTISDHRRDSDGQVLVAAAGWHDEHPGGAHKLPTDFARFLAAHGYRVAFMGASANVDTLERGTIDGVDLWRYPAPRAASPSLANLRQHWRHAQGIARAVQQERAVGALLGHSPLQYLAASSICVDARRCYGVHSPFVEELRHGVSGRPTLKQRAAWKVAAVIERRLLALSDVVHYDSAFTAHFMEDAYPAETRGKGMVLPGWVDAARFRPPSEPRSVLRRRLGHPWLPGMPTFFTLRRLVPRMGVDILIDAAARLARQGHAFQVVIGGEGPCRGDLEAQVAARSLRDRVAFLGRVPDASLPDCFAAADCFVLPTRALECFGLIVLESLACGVPVIGVPVGSIPEVMGPGLAAWIADANEPDAVARRMADALAGALSVDPVALRARALEFSFDAMASRHEAMLLGRRRRGAVA